MIKRFILTFIAAFVLFSSPVKASETKNDEALYGVVALGSYKTFCGAQLKPEAYLMMGLALLNYNEEEINAMKKRASDKFEEVGKRKFCIGLKRAFKKHEVNQLIYKHY